MKCKNCGHDEDKHIGRFPKDACISCDCEKFEGEEIPLEVRDIRPESGGVGIFEKKQGCRHGIKFPGCLECNHSPKDKVKSDIADEPNGSVPEDKEPKIGRAVEGSFDLSEARMLILSILDVTRKLNAKEHGLILEVLRIVEEQDKEFIKRLKARIERNKHLLDYQEREFYLNEIDKLAGEKLI